MTRTAINAMQSARRKLCIAFDDLHARDSTCTRFHEVKASTPASAESPRDTMQLAGALSACPLPAPAWFAAARSPKPAAPGRQPLRLTATGASTSEPSDIPDRRGESADRDARASSGAGAPADRPAAGNPAEEASAVVAACIDLMCQRRLDELVDFLPDAVVDRCLQRRKARYSFWAHSVKGLPTY